MTAVAMTVNGKPVAADVEPRLLLVQFLREMGNFHARQDDVRVDFSIYNGKTIRIIRTDKPEMGDYTPYFANTRLLEFQQDGAKFYAVEGIAFNYAAYKEGVLKDINSRYYRIPTWLPTGTCAFCRRLCGKDRCVAD